MWSYSEDGAVVLTFSVAGPKARYSPEKVRGRARTGHFPSRIVCSAVLRMKARFNPVRPCEEVMMKSAFVPDAKSGISWRRHPIITRISKGTPSKVVRRTKGDNSCTTHFGRGSQVFELSEGGVTTAEARKEKAQCLHDGGQALGRFTLSRNLGRDDPPRPAQRRTLSSSAEITFPQVRDHATKTECDGAAKKLRAKHVEACADGFEDRVRYPSPPLFTQPLLGHAQPALGHAHLETRGLDPFGSAAAW